MRRTTPLTSLLQLTRTTTEHWVPTGQHDTYWRYAGRRALKRVETARRVQNGKGASSRLLFLQKRTPSWDKSAYGPWDVWDEGMQTSGTELPRSRRVQATTSLRTSLRVITTSTRNTNSSWVCGHEAKCPSSFVLARPSTKCLTAGTCTTPLTTPARARLRLWVRCRTHLSGMCIRVLVRMDGSRMRVEYLRARRTVRGRGSKSFFCFVLPLTVIVFFVYEQVHDHPCSCSCTTHTQDLPTDHNDGDFLVQHAALGRGANCRTQTWLSTLPSLGSIVLRHPRTRHRCRKGHGGEKGKIMQVEATVEKHLHSCPTTPS